MSETNPSSPQGYGIVRRESSSSYSHSPYSWTPNLGLAKVPSREEIECSISSLTAGRRNSFKHQDQCSGKNAGKVTHKNPVGEMCFNTNQHYKPAAGHSPMTLNHNFNSYPSFTGSPPPAYYGSSNTNSGFNSESRPGFSERPLVGTHQSSFAPVSFSPTRSVGNLSYQSAYSAVGRGASPTRVISRGLVDSFLAHPAPGSQPPSSSASASNASSLAENLPLCTHDEDCILINEKTHQRKFAHTCRLFPCYHGHTVRHAKLFRHAPGQVALPEGVSKNLSTQALTSVTFSSISSEAPNAYRIYIAHKGKKYELFGDWENVKIHTFKRYLHQVCSILPASQLLICGKTSTAMDDDISSVKSYGIEVDSLILLKNRDEEYLSKEISFDDL